MADGYPDVGLGTKRSTALPDLQLPVYRGDTAAAEQGSVSPEERRLLAVIEAIKMRRAQRGDVGFDPAQQQQQPGVEGAMP
jgi:hypothetical protein